MNVQPFVAIDDESSAASGVPVEIAREQMHSAIEDFIKQALQFHALPAPEPDGVIDFNSKHPSHVAFKITTGVGKSEQLRRGAALFVLEQKRASHPRHRVMKLVPTHRLAEEASSKLEATFGAQGISTAIYQSREAKDLKTGDPLCRNLEAVKAAQSIGLDVQETCCKKGKVQCRFFDDCGFQRQRAEAMRADVVFGAHELMFTSLNRFGKDTFGLVIIDEGFSLKGVVQDPRQTRINIGALLDELRAHPVRAADGQVSEDETAVLRVLVKKLQDARAMAPDGHLSRVYLTQAGFVEGSRFKNKDDELYNPFASAAARDPFAEAAKLEYTRMVKIDLKPDTTAEERGRLVEQHKHRRQILRRARMWRTLNEFWNSNGLFDAGRLIVETVTENGIATRYLRVLGKKEIHETFTALPLLHGDATMEIELVQHHLPEITMGLSLDVLAPHERITQIVGLAVGKKILALSADKEKRPEFHAKQQARRDRLRKLVIHLARGRRTLVISQKDVEEVFAGIPNVETAHYGAIEGLDRYGDVEVLITIGRPMPSPSAIEMSGSALTGKPVLVGKRQVQVRPIMMKDGTERPLKVKSYVNDDDADVVFDDALLKFDNLANLLSRAIAEGGVLQALGRSRAVNRTAQNPVEAFVVLNDVTLPVPVDAVEHVTDVEPNEIDEMVTRGLVPEWPADAARLYPDLFKSQKAAEHKYRRDGRVSAMFTAATSYSGLGDTSRPKCPPDRYKEYTSYSVLGDTSDQRLKLCHFKPSGRGQRARRALVSAEVVPGARARIETALGELASFEIVGDTKPKAAPVLELVWGRPGGNFRARAAAGARPARPAYRLRCEAWGHGDRGDEREASDHAGRRVQPSGDHHGWRVRGW